MTVADGYRGEVTRQGSVTVIVAGARQRAMSGRRARPSLQAVTSERHHPSFPVPCHIVIQGIVTGCSHAPVTTRLSAVYQVSPARLMYGGRSWENKGHRKRHLCQSNADILHEIVLFMLKYDIPLSILAIQQVKSYLRPKFLWVSGRMAGSVRYEHNPILFCEKPRIKPILTILPAVRGCVPLNRHAGTQGEAFGTFRNC